MAFRLVSSGGNVVDPAMVNIRCSGVVWPGSVVEFSRTAGAGVNIASASSTTTNVFGVCMDYAQGASDKEVRIVPFAPGQLWEVDCVNAGLTAQIGLRHQLNVDALLVRNTSTDLGAGNAATAIFRAIAMVGSASGSGKLIGYVRTTEGTYFPSQTTYA